MVCVCLRSTCVWVGYHLHTAHLFGMHINSPLYRRATAGQTLHGATKRRDAAMLWSQHVGRTRPQKNQNQLVNSSRGSPNETKVPGSDEVRVEGEKKSRGRKGKNKQVATLFSTFVFCRHVTKTDRDSFTCSDFTAPMRLHSPHR